MKRKKIILIISIIILLITMTFTVIWLIFSTQIALSNAMTIEKLEDGLYSMEYNGNYGLDKFLEQGGAKSDEEIADFVTSYLSNGFYKTHTESIEKDFGCSTLVATDSTGSTIMGRNYDWQQCTAMIVHLKPENGYESISTTSLEFIGLDDSWNPNNITEKSKTLAAIYAPVDGINEKGLCIADLVAGDNEHTNQDTDKIDITTTMSIRLILDKAATTEEAIELLKKYDMNSSINFAHHFAISDASGKSVVVEYINNQIYVTETDVVTNHYLTEGKKYGVGFSGSEYRYESLLSIKENANGIMEMSDLKDAMRCVSSKGTTQWTIIYNTQTLAMDFYFRTQFNKPYNYTLN